MNKLDKQYTDLLQDILDNGITKQDRTGTGTLSVFGRQIRHKMSDGFPLLTTKKMAWKSIVTELLWFLRGDTCIKFLVDNGCNVWNGDAYKNYEDEVRNLGAWAIDDAKDYDEIYDEESGDTWEIITPLSQEEFINKIKTDDEFAKKWGELGPIYGAQWRNWNDNGMEGDYLKGVDQISNLINELKTNPDSRRLMVSAWNVGELDQMVLPPCHYGFQVYTRELSSEERESILLKIDDTLRTDTTQEVKLALKELNIPTRAISLMWNQRSVDTFLGLPFNIASYGLLLEIIAKAVNMVPDELIGNLGDVHLYLNHIEQAKEQIGRELSEDERYDLCAAQKSKMTAISEEDYIKYNIPTRTREPYPLPKLQFNPIFLANLEHRSFDEAVNGQVNFELENYQSHPAIKAPLSN